MSGHHHHQRRGKFPPPSRAGKWKKRPYQQNNKWVRGPRNNAKPWNSSKPRNVVWTRGGSDNNANANGDSPTTKSEPERASVEKESNRNDVSNNSNDDIVSASKPKAEKQETTGTNKQAKEDDGDDTPILQVNLQRRGHNKLVSQICSPAGEEWCPKKRPKPSSHSQPGPPSHYRPGPPKSLYHPHQRLQPPKPSNPSHSSRTATAGLKRVRLNGPSVSEEPESSKRLTDFAYRESTKVPQRGKKKSTNMSLVRVQPDEATTPICPFFLRGMTCTSKTCTKRHDVPREAAVPICHFFQRYGQCSRGETCKFRHVKVNPHTTECTSFSLLGFCQDKDCPMKHVRPTAAKSIQR